MLVIQLERVDYLKENNYPNNDEVIVDFEEFIDGYEDGCVVGLGYTSLSVLEKDDLDDEVRKMLNIFKELGCEVDRLNDIVYFTDEFCLNYNRAYFDAYKEKMSSLTLEEFALMKTKEEFDELEKLRCFYDVEVASYSLDAFLTNFTELTGCKFTPFNKPTRKNVERVGFKIVAMAVGY